MAQEYYPQMNFFVDIKEDIMDMVNILDKVIIINIKDKEKLVIRMMAKDFNFFSRVMDFKAYLMHILHYLFNFNVFIFYHNN